VALPTKVSRNRCVFFNVNITEVLGSPIPVFSATFTDILMKAVWLRAGYQIDDVMAFTI
jgi:hypothetical protein